jgi:HEAT repeat protein
MTSANTSSEEDSTFNHIQARRTAVSLAGYTENEATARSALRDADSTVRAAALSALHRIGTLTSLDVAAALTDSDLRVRRRACELSTFLPLQSAGSTEIDDHLLRFLQLGDDTMAELGAWSLGERHQQQSLEHETLEHEILEHGSDRTQEATSPVTAGSTQSKSTTNSTSSTNTASTTSTESLVNIVNIVQALSDTVYKHPDALVREAAVAALGCIGTPSAKAPILHAIGDKATVRRRAIIALSAFEGDDVEAALSQATSDRDWQVRQAAEDLLA